MARYGLKYYLEWQLQANNRFKSGQECQRCRRLSDSGLASHEKESMKGGIPLSLRGDVKGAGEVFSNAFFFYLGSLSLLSGIFLGIRLSKLTVFQNARLFASLQRTLVIMTVFVTSDSVAVKSNLLL